MGLGEFAPGCRQVEEAHTGFEPVLREDDDEPPLGREPEARAASELPADLQRIVERLTKRLGADLPPADESGRT
jgi:hypothetical protein